MNKVKPYTKRKLKFETLQLHVGQEQPDPATDARAVPIYATSSYVFHDCDHAAARFSLEDAGNIYGRLTNPTQDVFERRIAALEGGTAALAVASGAAAVTYTIQNLARSGEHIVAANNIYGGTYNLLAHTLPEYGIHADFVNPADPENFERAIRDNTKALYVESFVIPIPILRTWRRWRRSPTGTGSRWWWTARLPRLICCGPSSTERTLSSIRLQNSSAAMERPSEA